MREKMDMISAQSIVCQDLFSFCNCDLVLLKQFKCFSHIRFVSCGRENKKISKLLSAIF
jgi:hypothetical protein